MNGWLRRVVGGQTGRSEKSYAQLLLENWETGSRFKLKFETSALEDFRDFGAIDAAGKDVVKQLRRRQLEIIKSTAARAVAVSDPPQEDDGLEVALTELSGAKLLYRAVVSLGLPETLAHDEYLQALLYGSENESLLDQYGISSTVTRGETEDEDVLGSTYRRRPFGLVYEAADRRLQALEEVIMAHLRLHVAESFREAPPMVSEALKRMRISSSVAAEL